MVSFVTLKQGVINYLDAELVSKVSNPIAKVGMVSALYVIDKKATGLFNTLRENKIIKAMEIIDCDGNVDADLLLDAIREGMRGQSVVYDTNIIGTITIHPDDVERLRAYIR